jgi:hypothetical protein
MSEWIDFAIYAFEACALWVLMPRWSARMTLPMMRNRNAAWVDANPGVMATVKPGSWFLKACYAWAVFTIAVLLVLRLGLQPQDILPEAQAAPAWKVMMSTNNLLLAIGLVSYFSGGAVFMRWLTKTVPQSGLRQATLQPRTAEHYVPRRFRMLVHAAIAAHLLAWMYAALSGLRHGPRFWWFFAGMAGMTIVLFLVTQSSIRRRPDHMDRAIGDDMRKVEVRLMYTLQLCLVALGIMALSRGLDISDTAHLGRRIGNLVFSLFCALTILGLTRMPAQRRGGGAPGLAGRTA